MEWGKGLSAKGGVLTSELPPGDRGLRPPTARQSRLTLLPSFTVTGEEIFTMRAGTVDRREGQ